MLSGLIRVRYANKGGPKKAMPTGVRIDNLPVDYSEDEIRALVRPYGTPLHVTVCLCPERMAARGYVQMLTPMEAALTKLNLHRSRLYGEELLVFFEDEPRADGNEEDGA